jgi:hypothetical protein
MIGSKLARQSTAAVCAILVAGCVGLGDPTPGGVDATRLRRRPQPPVEKATPELRIPEDTVARGEGPDIPLVPVPSPPIRRQTPRPVSPPALVIPAEHTTAPGTASPPATSATPPQTTPSQTPPHTARQLLQQATARCAALDSYIARLTRREFHKDKAQPEEIMLFKFRRNPWSVHFKWLGETARGREVIYVKGQYDNKIHTKLAAGDAPLMPAGARIAVAPDSFLARSASRHPITDAGICHCVESLTALLDRQESGDKREGTLVAVAPQKLPEYPKPVETLERIIPPNVEPELPRGGRRLICFDPDWQLPLLVITYDDKGREVEYYRYDRLQTPVNLDDDDFNPDKLWGAPKAKAASPSRDRKGADGSTAP